MGMSKEMVAGGRVCVCVCVGGGGGGVAAQHPAWPPHKRSVSLVRNIIPPAPFNNDPKHRPHSISDYIVPRNHARR
jgi:hypothetical protein